MFWKLVQLVFGLGICVPIIAMTYYHFTNTSNGTFVNGTTVNSTALGVTPAELSYWSILPIVLALMLLVAIGMLLTGMFNKSAEG